MHHCLGILTAMEYGDHDEHYQEGEFRYLQFLGEYVRVKKYTHHQFRTPLRTNTAIRSI